ncbi:carbohydrate sulfotransferase 11-like [Saccoglossus kowalevskii]|uniref:Carbohydrate sulfotransferase n=1 Tax=Saccoglossus kowalevskii TaxID=10224 RepID=A0ABM0MZK1_SACKO|nr:PREDICTED: carbohydrate sulfotransferase 11-like [Saccoglossus kowalevskii]
MAAIFLAHLIESGIQSILSSEQIYGIETLPLPLFNGSHTLFPQCRSSLKTKEGNYHPLTTLRYDKDWAVIEPTNEESTDKEYRHVSVVRQEKNKRPNKSPLNTSDTEKNDVYNCWKASAKRVKLAENACRDNNLTYTQPRMVYFVVSEKYKFMFKLMPKVSSTTWKNFLPIIDPECFKSSKEMELNLTITDVEKYTKIIFFREPLERLVSFYYNNIHYTANQSSQNKQYDDLIKKIGLRSHSVIAHNPKGKEIYNITFIEFVKMVIHHHSYGEYMPLGGHLVKQYQRSYVCSFKYDFIGHFEQLGEDAACVLELIGLDNIYRFPDIHAQKGNLRYKESLGSLPKYVLESLIEVYRLDYEIFGYRIPTFEEFKFKQGL